MIKSQAANLNSCDIKFSMKANIDALSNFGYQYLLIIRDIILLLHAIVDYLERSSDISCFFTVSIASQTSMGDLETYSNKSWCNKMINEISFRQKHSAS